MNNSTLAAPPIDSAHQHITVIEAGKTEKQYWKDIWRYRELLGFLAWRDILIRYKQTVFGVAWAVVRPLLTMAAFSFVLHKIAHLPSSGGAPYPILVFAGLLPWQYFSYALNDCSNSVVQNASMVSKVYFPRILIPTSNIISNGIDYLINVALLAVLMLVYRYPPHWTILALPLCTLFVVIATLGPGVFVAAMNVKYRDFRHLIPFVVQFGMYISPVGFSAHLISPQWQLVYALNPLVSVIDSFRWCIIGPNAPIQWNMFIVSSIVNFALLYAGITYFRKTERTFADVI